MTMCRFGLSLPKRCRRGVIPASVVIFTLVWLCVACAFTGVAGASPDEVLKINRITPSGPDVPAGRQIVFEFDRPVVPLGKMGRAASEVPVVIEPALSCQWRWLSPSTLACQLGEQNAMVPATSYKVTVEPGIRAEDGTALTKRVVHGFTTRRPRITSCDFQQWVSPVLPRFRVHLNQPVHKASLEQHLFFQMEGGGRVAPKVVEDTKYSKTAPRGTIWLVSPSADLPLDKAGALVVEPGISSTLGKEPGSEKRKAAEFQTMPAFRFLGIQCRNLAGAELILAPGKTVSSQSRCNPQGAISLLFSSPVMQSELQNKVKILKGSKGIEAGPEIWMDSDYSKLGDTRLKGQKYESFLESDNIAAFSEYRLQAKVNSIKDEFGRPLATPIDMSFATDHRPPDLTIYRNMSALEKGLETDLPMFATNIDQIEIKYQALTSQGRSSAKTEVLPGPKARDVVVTVPLGSRKLLRAPSGILTGAIATRPHLPEREYQPRWFIAQITPFHVHVKLGHFNTVVWVTDLQTGEPVPGVEVSLRKDIMKDLGGSPEVLSTARTGPDGVAELEGSANADPTLTLLQSAYNRDGPMLFVSCQKEGDLALVPLHYEFQVDSEASNHRYIPSWSRARHGHMRSWGATAQGIYKVGDTVQYKIYVRDQENRRFVRPPADTYILKVLDPTSKIIHQRDNIKLSEFGAFDGEFPIPKNGAVGYYSFQLGGTLTKNQMEPLQVLVSDFTPSPFKVITELNGGMFGTGDAVEVTTQARMHSGGPFGRARTRITASVERMPFTPASPLARGFEFDVIKTDDDETTTPGGTQTVFQTQAGLDDGGNLVSRFSVAETPVLYGRLSVESSVQDDRGKSVAGRAVATYFGRDRFVGLFQEDWLIQEGRPAKAKLIVVDQDGNAVPEAPVHVTIERLQTMAARVRGAGDAYPSQYEKEWIPVQELDLSSGEQPVEFEFTPDKSGTIRITAKVVDTKERPQETALNRWVVGKGHVLWETREGSLLNMYAEKEEYRVGDTVKLLVQNPFPGASAMITVERYGTLDRWVRKFESSTEVVEIPVQPDYLPGFYVSVMVMSPRVEKPLGPAGEDLGKPAFRMGYAKIEVKDQYKEIAVQCKPDREVYKPGETVEIDFEARPKNIVPGEKPVPIEIAVAVLDEAVFDLLKQKKQAFDPYRGFYHLEDLDLQNYNLLMQLIGREKLEKKGASPAAAAGFDLSMRTVFKFVSYWNPSLRVDEEGRAKVRFQLPDNLTGWRVLAMAVTPDDRMGLGETAFKVNQSTEIRPVMPNQVLEGDSFSAGFTVMNRTGESRNIEVKVTAEGPCTLIEPSSAPEGSPSMARTILAEPYRRYTLRFPLKALGPGEITFTAQARDDTNRDGMRHSLKVLKQRPQEVAAVYGSVVSGEAVQAVTFPGDMRPELSSLGVSLSPTIVGGLAGTFRYMKEYPYECWEQKLSRAVLAGLFPKLDLYMPKTVGWENSEAVARNTLVLAGEFQAPNGGMAFYLPRDDYVSPYLSAFTALAFNWLRESGHVPPAPVEEKLQKYLLEYLKRDEAKAAWGIAVADVRAVALLALASGGKASRGDLERHWKHFQEMSLFGKASFLEALGKVPELANLRGEALGDILSHADQSGGTIRFGITADPALYQVLSSPTRDNAAILLALLSIGDGDSAAAELGDIPVRLMRTITSGRKSRDHWASTQENLFAAMATLRYSKHYEASATGFKAKAFLDKDLLGEARFDGPAVESASFEYHARENDPGRKTSVRITKEGEGRLYYSTRLSYSPVEIEAQSINSGIEINREYSVEREGRWVLLKDEGQIRTGELVRVDLFLSLPAERYFVVVDDPVPGGLEPVSRELATASEVDAAKSESPYASDSLRNRYTDWRSYGVSRWSFYHKELRHDSARFYSERLGAGRYHLSYTAQAVAPGQFSAMPARAEEMYNPDVFGRSRPAQIRIDPAE